ncbi:protein SHQ1 homolog isoform X1 [Octopus sinensis]|uniref:Protein SHQ1 homolog n=1 Tax=Octopus sinensis TaxID=2607531 RepID=A0A6P7SP21_9MOLL|nr:protein SHQ1 homolog isoform X1 [Octopus sinensis]XP_036359410.1 protein SHQ1 homolog isoform X1 [Octopus sinensis]
MLTPRFELSQDDDFLHIIIDAVLAKISDTEIFIDDDEFIFYSTPYYLRLHLPGKLVEDGRETCTYNDGKFSLQIPKKVAGEMFEGLEMLTKLLTPKGKYSAKSPLIEVLNNETSASSTKEHKIGEDANEEEEFDWYFEQEPPSAVKDTVLQQYCYGFANKRSGVFQNLAEEFSETCDIRHPDEMSPQERTEKRCKLEAEQFDPDYYIADFIDEENIIKKLCSYVCPWSCEKDGNLVPFPKSSDLTEQEKYILTQLPKKQYLLDNPKDVMSVYLGLVDILFAYSYDVRTTEGEKTVESGWTVAKLSSTLSCFETYISLKDVIIASFRRSLSYPLYRNWQLSMAVLSDVQFLFNSGRLHILKCLLEVKELMQEYNLNHILNDLYITDYCVWIQTACAKQLQSLATELSKVTITKEDCNLELEDWENIAIGEMDNLEVDTVTENLCSLKVRDSDDSSTENESVTDSSSESSSGHSTGSDSEDSN